METHGRVTGTNFGNGEKLGSFETVGQLVLLSERTTHIRFLESVRLALGDISAVSEYGQTVDGMGMADNKLIFMYAASNGMAKMSGIKLDENIPLLRDELKLSIYIVSLPFCI